MTSICECSQDPLYMDEEWRKTLQPAWDMFIRVATIHEECMDGKLTRSEYRQRMFGIDDKKEDQVFSCGCIWCVVCMRE